MEDEKLIQELQFIIDNAFPMPTDIYDEATEPQILQSIQVLQEKIKSRNGTHADARSAYVNALCIKNGKPACSFQVMRELLEWAANQGVSEAQCLWGAFLWCRTALVSSENEMEVETSWQMGAEWMQKAAKQGNSLAQYLLGRYYFMRQEQVKDEEALCCGIQLIQDAAKARNLYALFYLAHILLEQENDPKSISQGVAFLQEAADLKNPAAMEELGLLYWSDTYVRQDIAKGLELLEDIAASGNTSAMFDLANGYFQMGLSEITAEEALHWLRTIIEKDAPTELQADAMVSLGNCYLDGDGVETVPEKVFAYYKEVAALDNAEGKNMLGRCYLSEIGTKKSVKQAIYWLKASADDGFAAAQYNLGNVYFNGIDCIAADEETAFDYFKKAARQGMSEAQYMVGNCYHFGRGTKPNEEKALKWLRRASQQENAEAQFALAMCLLYQESMNPKDDKEAVYWLKKVAAQGDVLA
ncbi:MAG: sel1 repeat family protein [Ruminococcus sp.]|nr:sel1 repeat family protein [Ruminococcus sp.]